jgi:hypothetical protein
MTIKDFAVISFYVTPQKKWKECVETVSFGKILYTVIKYLWTGEWVQRSQKSVGLERIVVLVAKCCW